MVAGGNWKPPKRKRPVWLLEVQKQTVAAAVAEEFVVAGACRKQIVNIISVVAESGKVCTCCFTAFPSNQARQSLLGNGMAAGNLFVASAM